MIKKLENVNIDCTTGGIQVNFVREAVDPIDGETVDIAKRVVLPFEFSVKLLQNIGVFLETELPNNPELLEKFPDLKAAMAVAIANLPLKEQ